MMTLFFLLFLSGCLSALGQERPNPHGRSDACSSCHAASGPPAYAHGTVDATCMSCHPDDSPHQTGLAPDKARVPDGLPLVDGKLACLTCHDEPACSGSPMDPLNPRFWRGGPYRRVGDLCHRCHAATDPNRYDPHTAMKEHPGEPEVCAYCHQEAPARDGVDPDVHVNAQKMCEGCHQGTPHAGAVAHVGKKDAAIAARASAAGLPLGPDGAIECATCHDVHPVGSTATSDARRERIGRPLFPASWESGVLRPGLAARDFQDDPVSSDPDFLRLPLRSGELCLACHAPDDVDARRKTNRGSP